MLTTDERSNDCNFYWLNLHSYILFGILQQEFGNKSYTIIARQYFWQY